MSDYHLNGWSDELDRQDGMKMGSYIAYRLRRKHRQPKPVGRRHLAFRCGFMIRHIAEHNSFDKQDLIQLLKDVKRELEKEREND